MMTNDDNIWEKWDGMWNAIFYISLLLSLAFMLLDNVSAIGLLLTILMAGWHWLGLRWAYQNIESWYEKPLSRVIVIVVDIVLWFMLVNISVAYYFVLFGLFTQVFRHLPTRYAVSAALLLTVAMIMEQLSDTSEILSLTNPAVWLFFFMGFVGIIIGIWISAVIEQSTARRELIEELQATRTQLAASERREGVLEERQRLTREIHDTLAQGFTSVIMHLEAADQALGSDPNTLQRHLNRAAMTARHSLAEARRVVRDLRPDLLEQGSLLHAIERTAQRWQEETGISACVRSTGDTTPLQSAIEVTLLRAVQEALHNIHKHAQATEVQVTLSYMDNLVMLDVQDDGIGLAVTEPSELSGGYGLQIMRERVEQISGSITLESDPGEGTIVTITIPHSG